MPGSIPTHWGAVECSLNQVFQTRVTICYEAVQLCTDARWLVNRHTVRHTGPMSIVLPSFGWCLTESRLIGGQCRVIDQVAREGLYSLLQLSGVHDYHAFVTYLLINLLAYCDQVLSPQTSTPLLMLSAVSPIVLVMVKIRMLAWSLCSRLYVSHALMRRRRCPKEMLKVPRTTQWRFWPKKYMVLPPVGCMWVDLRIFQGVCKTEVPQSMGVRGRMKVGGWPKTA